MVTKNKPLFQHETNDENLILKIEQCIQKAEQFKFQQFKNIYRQQFNSTFFKNPWSTMNKMLNENKITTFSEVEEYAQKNPKTRTTKILASNFSM